MTEAELAATARTAQQVDEMADRLTAALTTLTQQQVPALAREVQRLRAGLDELYEVLPTHEEHCPVLNNTGQACTCALGVANALIQRLLEGQHG